MALATNGLKTDTLTLAHVMAMSIAGIGPTSYVLFFRSSLSKATKFLAQDNEKDLILHFVIADLEPIVASIFFMSGQISSAAGASAPFSLIVASVVCLSLGWTIREFAKHISSAGSFYAFVTAGLGKEFGFLTGWFMICGYGILTIETILQFGCWSSDVIYRNSGFWLHWGYLGVLVSLLCAFMAWRGINPALKLSLFLCAFETVVILVLCFFIVIKGGGTGGIMQSLVYACLVFIGFETAAVLGEETQNPKRNIGLAVTTSILITLVYMTFGVYSMVVAFGPSQATQLKFLASPADAFARKYVARWFAWFIDFAGISATFNVCSSGFNNMYRILYSLGRENVLGMRFFGITAKGLQTPIGSILVFTLFGLLAALGFGLGSSSADSISVGNTEGCWLAYGYTSFAGTIPLLLVFILTNIALPVFIKKTVPADFSIWRHVMIPIFSALSLLVPLVGNFYPSPPTPPNNYFVYILIGWVVVGVVLVLLLRRFSPESLEKMGSAFAATQATAMLETESEPLLRNTDRLDESSSFEDTSGSSIKGYQSDSTIQ